MEQRTQLELSTSWKEVRHSVQMLLLPQVRQLVMLQVTHSRLRRLKLGLQVAQTSVSLHVEQLATEQEKGTQVPLTKLQRVSQTVQTFSTWQTVQKANEQLMQLPLKASRLFSQEVQKSLALQLRQLLTLQERQTLLMATKPALQLVHRVELATHPSGLQLVSVQAKMQVLLERLNPESQLLQIWACRQLAHPVMSQAMQDLVEGSRVKPPLQTEHTLASEQVLQLAPLQTTQIPSRALNPVMHSTQTLVVPQTAQLVTLSHRMQLPWKAVKALLQLSQMIAPICPPQVMQLVMLQSAATQAPLGSIEQRLLMQLTQTLGVARLQETQLMSVQTTHFPAGLIEKEVLVQSWQKRGAPHSTQLASSQAKQKPTLGVTGTTKPLIVVVALQVEQTSATVQTSQRSTLQLMAQLPAVMLQPFSQRPQTLSAEQLRQLGMLQRKHQPPPLKKVQPSRQSAQLLGSPQTRQLVTTQETHCPMRLGRKVGAVQVEQTLLSEQTAQSVSQKRQVVPVLKKVVTLLQVEQTPVELQVSQLAIPQKKQRPLEGLKVQEGRQAEQTPASELQVLQSLTTQGTQAASTSPNPAMHWIQTPTVWQESQLVTPQLEQAAPLTKKPAAQSAHSLASLHLSQFWVLQVSQLVAPARLRLKPTSQPLQTLAETLQLMQCQMLQLRHWARLSERVWPTLQVSQMLLKEQRWHWSMVQATQVPVLLTEKPSLQVPQKFSAVQLAHSAGRHWMQLPSLAGLQKVSQVAQKLSMLHRLHRSILQLKHCPRLGVKPARQESHWLTALQLRQLETPHWMQD